jgi:hypothetical protein
VRFGFGRLEPPATAGSLGQGHVRLLRGAAFGSRRPFKTGH